MEQIIFWLAGAFGVPLVNALKKRSGWRANLPFGLRLPFPQPWRW